MTLWVLLFYVIPGLLAVFAVALVLITRAQKRHLAEYRQLPNRTD
jgi:hypothetical protein